MTYNVSGVHTRGQNVINFLVRKKVHKFSKIYILFYIYILYIHIHIHIHQGFSITFDKGLRKNIKKIKDGEIGKHKLN